MEIRLNRNNKITLSKRLMRIAAVTAVFLIMITVLSVITVKHAGKNSEFTPELTDVKYPSLFYHYTGFDWSDTKASVKPSWIKSTVRLKDEKAVVNFHTIVYPITLKDKSVTYKISDENIASIDENGKITAHQPGMVKITATLNYNGESTEAELNIIQSVTGIFMPQSTITMNISDSLKHLEPTIYPENATDKTLSWSTSDSKVVRVDQNGNIKPMSTGMAEIIAKTNDGSFSGKCFVTVVNKTVAAESVIIQNKENIKLDAGQSMNMIATVTPSGTRDKTLKWESSNPAIATVSKTGKLKALAQGKTVITVKTSNGKTDSFELNVSQGTQKNALDLYASRTSNEPISTNILGKTYINNSGSNRTSSANNGEVRYTSYDMTITAMTKLQMSLNPPPKINGGNTYASEMQVAEAINPESYYTGPYKFQFLDLSHSNGLDADTLNEFLSNKGILAGQGQAFIDAANKYNVSEVYLIAHSCLETGNGTSTLAKGVEVNGTVVYNMYGIGAYDNGAVYYGSQRAYSQGWTSVSAAIIGGAKWISENYINNASHQQNTLYKMRWNPDNPTEHQYATDIEWATQQASNIQKIFFSFPDAVLTYEVPVYRGQTAITIN